MFTRLLIVFFIFGFADANSQSILTYSYFDTSKLSAGFQSNRIGMVNANHGHMNLQMQTSVVNDRLINQLFNLAVRYNIDNHNTRITPSFSFENNYGFGNPVFRSIIEIQHKVSIFTAAVMAGWNFDQASFLYQGGLNARITRKISLQSNYGNYRMEIFGDEKALENGLVITVSPLILKFYNQLPAEDGKLEYRHSRFITSFLITILNKS